MADVVNSLDTNCCPAHRFLHWPDHVGVVHPRSNTDCTESLCRSMPSIGMLQTDWGGYGMHGKTASSCVCRTALLLDDRYSGSDIRLES
jgi:hypothetical protein